MLSGVSREEKRLIRQRGAGTRELKDVAFGFSFGAAGPAEPEAAVVEAVPTAEAESRPSPVAEPEEDAPKTKRKRAPPQKSKAQEDTSPAPKKRGRQRKAAVPTKATRRRVTSEDDADEIAAAAPLVKNVKSKGTAKPGRSDADLSPPAVLPTVQKRAVGRRKKASAVDAVDDVGHELPNGEDQSPRPTSAPQIQTEQRASPSPKPTKQRKVSAKTKGSKITKKSRAGRAKSHSPDAELDVPRETKPNPMEDSIEDPDEHSQSPVEKQQSKPPPKRAKRKSNEHAFKASPDREKPASRKQRSRPHADKQPSTEPAASEAVPVTDQAADQANEVPDEVFTLAPESQQQTIAPESEQQIAEPMEQRKRPRRPSPSEDEAKERQATTKRSKSRAISSEAQQAAPRRVVKPLSRFAGSRQNNGGGDEDPGDLAAILRRYGDPKIPEKLVKARDSRFKFRF